MTDSSAAVAVCKSSSIESRPKLLIFIVAYRAESTIKHVLTRIPRALAEQYDTEVLVIDDASADRTFECGREVQRDGLLPFPVTVLRNPINQGYGGNQKIGYFYAIRNEFNFVALLHGDGQYAPECLPDLVCSLNENKADACFGSRMMAKNAARAGGMPLYKFLGNKILSRFENWFLRTSFSEFHSGYRVYSVAALKQIPFELNTNDFHFDTEIIIQFVRAGLRITERPIPTYYGEEICRVNGLKYAWNVVQAVVKARAQDLGLFYDRRFDVSDKAIGKQYELKLNFQSPHSMALELIPPKSRVLDLGCAGGYMSAALKRLKDCYVAGVDVHLLDSSLDLDEFHRINLNDGLSQLKTEGFHFILLLDVLEHLYSPERFIEGLLDVSKLSPDIRIVLSTGNIGFIITRLMLMIGQFNYGKRGILDLTHTRLFTFSSLRALFEQGGFRITEVRGIPAPFPLAIKNERLARLLLYLNRLLIKMSRGLFSYQIFMVVQPYPSLEYLLRTAEEQSAVADDLPAVYSSSSS
jgi:2-polyprenyl-3-methyl-5-hydroxy-6-metoxy-1,4-benzoquinol methylase